MRQQIKCIRFYLFFFLLSGLHSLLFSQQFLDEIRKRLPMPDQNKLFEAQALEFKGKSILEKENSRAPSNGIKGKKNASGEALLNIEQLDALVFFAFSNELKFEVFDKGMKQFWHDYKGGWKETDVLHKFEKTIYDSLDLVSDLRRATDKDKTISAKMLLLKKAGYLENHATLQMGKLLYIYLRLPEPYNKNWLVSEELSDPYYFISQNSQDSNSIGSNAENDYQKHLQQALQVFNLLEITESQIDFFNEFLANKYPRPDSSIDFGKLAYCNMDSLKYQWQAYLYSGGNTSDSTISGLLALLSKSSSDNKKSSASFSFKIQIMASRDKLSEQAMHKIYSGSENIDVNIEDNWYKYTIGKFKSYKDAKVFQDKIKVEGAFIVAYLNGKRVEVTTYNRISTSKPIVHEIGVR